MDSCDVLIVGGGPAGSTLAWKLRTCGLDVVVLDKSTFPRDKVCAGWITPQTTDLLDLDTDEYSRGRVLQHISGFRTGMIGKSGIVTRYGRTISYGIRRSEFDHYLLKRSGARLRLGEPLRTMQREKDAWIINDDMKTPLVVGAGGHFCPVSRSLRGDQARKEAAVIAQEVEFEMDERQQRECSVEGDTPELYFYEDLKGYAWCVRKGNFLNIGLGREDKHNVAEQVRSFFVHLKETRRIPEDTPANFKGHAYLLYQGVSQSTVDDGVMLIGDAVGLAHPKSGEGIRPAVESALIAAEVILSAAGDYRRSTLLRYPSLLAGRFGKAGNSPAIVPQAATRFISRRLMESSWFSEHILLDRWFLNAHRSALR
jgi:geranylgeranyl reductase family protein